MLAKIIMPDAPSPHDSSKSEVRPLTDSVWFWIYVFGTAALVALYLGGPKYGLRQSQIERQFSARQSGGQAVSGVDGPVEPSTANEVIIPLNPLFLLMGILLVVGCAGLWWQRFRARSRSQ